ncbi:type II toxin-antitoxin system VapB family antitoxin [Chelatococcus sambhunathii]|uniref:Type II toxin-antitoxin system VapB family antitoxin n=1 Tax=Chelatococcus sambhunathii TaxID=363953 RepID=A0ABU1DDQ9_9HYPH|nr:type II toxin-antitoxin system VapB family antitoxin [Chelatococcus sambhunathii]MDR4306236.1 type II toxin-antitoxin system VapB family antitoxin [Chelatococcus sambhunathii]
MALFVKDPSVDVLAERLMRLKKVNKTEAVRIALENEIARERDKPDLVERTAEFVRQFKARANPQGGSPADKEFIDSLYE